MCVYPNTDLHLTSLDKSLELCETYEASYNKMKQSFTAMNASGIDMNTKNQRVRQYDIDKKEFTDKEKLTEGDLRKSAADMQDKTIVTDCVKL